MLFHCFLDDSKDQNQSKLLVSAGFLGTKDDWHRLRIGWKKQIKKDGVNYFKTSEYKMLNGEFSRFKAAAYPPPTGREAASRIRSNLQATLRKNPRILGVGMAIPVDDYNRVCARPEAQGIFPGDPYQRALEGVLLEAVTLAHKLTGPSAKVAFVHDDGPDFDHLRAVYNGFKIANPKTAESMIGFLPLSYKEHPPLQLADMVANFTLGVGLDWLANGREARWASEMQDNIGKLGIWTEHFMLSVLKRNLIRKGKPVPLDLQADEYG
ncbi:MAG: DUF3800 domain-containing protein [Methylocella sp.]